MSETSARHEWIDAWCGHLENLLQQPSSTTPQTGRRLVALPAWLWLAPAISIGRKAVRADGRTMLMPVRVTWPDAAHLVALPAGTHHLPWSATGLGHAVTGVLTVQVTEHGVHSIKGCADLAPTDHGPDTQAARAALLQRADTSRWQARMSLERYVEQAVDAAVATVTRDVLGLRSVHSVLDATSTETVRDAMLLGTGQTPGAVDRIIERSLAPAAFVRVDPLHYLTVDLRRAAEAYVRRAISDPPIGRKIRTVQRAMPGASLDEVVAAYRQAHPRDFLSMRRAARALSAGADLNASAAREPRAATARTAVDVEALALARAENATSDVTELAARSRRALAGALNADLRRAS
ncbi:hypothetical protein CHO01_28950 [Cellulomonas hominis]|uniref:Uncharacterized protein n=1 Tax=Cellulomonas hominis TaxID=156981 RepID=A0A511FEV4_9CELL|nr:hypothetical protein [Cellulomonas hominis]MBB5474755.1 hypothetical protein [Cellulomonas hominis]NKY05411.1 hypothetical protein [Cellulomonas hominis]GEL47779.1 hypothetical protein CHO01_28950 [Cellulomonas hominis]